MTTRVSKRKYPSGIDKYLRLMEGEFGRAKAFIEAKIAGKCPMCARISWQLDDYMSSPVMSCRNSELSVGQFVDPNLTLVCTNCGFVAHFRTQVAGVKSPRRMRLTKTPAKVKS